MAAPWQENPHKVVVEFQKTGQGARRMITLKHQAGQLPPQLQGRVPPEVWGAFMQEVHGLAETHPYVVNPSAGRVLGWGGGAIFGAIFGFCCINPDGGDYNVWVPQVQQVLARHQAAFNAGGAHLSMQRAQMSYWIQIDVDPSMAVGQPVPGHNIPHGAGPYDMKPAAGPAGKT